MCGRKGISSTEKGCFMGEKILIGLDLGTQGVRAAAADARGQLIAEASRRYSHINVAEEPYKEQRAEEWRQASMEVLAETARALRAAKPGFSAVLAVDGTSGTILPLDSEGRPLSAALMYNDSRASSVMDELHENVKGLEEKLGYRMSASFSLPKILWIQKNWPWIYEKAASFVHQADYLTGCLTGNFRVTDYSNALKSGYDLIDEKWEGGIFCSLGIDRKLLPDVVMPGWPVGRITAAAAAETGLPADTEIVAGTTDGYSSCVASGVVRPGQYNTTIGTTIVLKGVTEQFIKDPKGRVYCHKHPQGYWYPGGAGNVGGICLNQWFGEENFAVLNSRVPAMTPTGNVIYPLTMKGERFPFVNPEAEAFFRLRNEGEEARYAGTMEGVGYVERLCYDTLEGLGCPPGDTVTIAGGAVKAPVWSQIRADILGKRLVQPAMVEASYGTAVIAGTVSLGRNLCEAAELMVKHTRVFEPDVRRHAAYNGLYEEFCDICRKRNYIDEYL